MIKTELTKRWLPLAGAFAVMTSAGSLFGGDYGKAVIDDKMPIEADPWTPCDIFDYSTLYESENGIIREVSFNGRYHGQYISQSETANFARNGFHQWQHRRFRFGVDIEFAGDLTLKTSANISDGTGAARGLTRGPFFNNWDEFYLDWEPSDDFYVQVGKQKQKITREYTTSSKQMLTIERAHIVNEVADQKPWGVTVGFELGCFSHEVGAWLGGLDRNAKNQWDWPGTNSRSSFSYRAATDLNDATSLHLDYVYTNTGIAGVQGNADGRQGSNYRHVVALGTESEWGNFGLITDLIAGSDHDNSAGLNGNSTWGAVVMPYYNITDNLQFVAKYAYMSDGRNQRTQRFAVRQNVEDYSTYYAGFNYFICDHNLKLMAGYEYATGDIFQTNQGIESSSWLLGVRTYW